MALVLEDGSSVTGADAYDSIANVETYLAAYGGAGTAWTALATDADKEPHVRLATRYLDAEFGARWPGRASSSTQGLDWPRAGARTLDGYSIDWSGSLSIPTELKQAVAILADKSATGELMPDQTSPGTIKRTRSKVGTLEREIEYVAGQDQATSYRVVENLLANILAPANDLGRA